MKLDIKHSFEKDVQKIMDVKILHDVEIIVLEADKINNLSEFSYPIKKLKKGKNNYRVKLGDFRLGFTMDQEMITFVRILHRKDIYNYFL